mmetsp:Transcript_4477/g.8787  ORF Transcript_4477/g.8787 Transcript_4477/m.8787 type:complete len:268 (-) Transcript_4477:45-848(-)
MSVPWKVRWIKRHSILQPQSRNPHPKRWHSPSIVGIAYLGSNADETLIRTNHCAALQEPAHQVLVRGDVDVLVFDAKTHMGKVEDDEIVQTSQFAVSLELRAVYTVQHRRPACLDSSNILFCIIILLSHFFSGVESSRCDVGPLVRSKHVDVSPREGEVAFPHQQNLGIRILGQKVSCCLGGAAGVLFLLHPLLLLYCGTLGTRETFDHLSEPSAPRTPLESPLYETFLALAHLADSLPVRLLEAFYKVLLRTLPHPSCTLKMHYHA